MLLGIKNTGSVNCTEFLMLLDSLYPTQAFTFQDVYHIEELCQRFKGGFMLSLLKSFKKISKNRFNMEGFTRYIDKCAKSESHYNDINYCIEFNTVPLIFREILEFVCTGYSREDFLLIDSIMNIFTVEVIRTAIKEQDNDWNYPKLLFKKCTEIKMKEEELVRCAKAMEEKIDKQRKNINKDINPLKAINKMNEWESTISEEDMWNLL